MRRMPRGGMPPARSPTPLRIAAASDLQAALPRLADRFQARTGIAIDADVPRLGAARRADQGKGLRSTSSWRPTRRSSATWPAAG